MDAVRLRGYTEKCGSRTQHTGILSRTGEPSRMNGQPPGAHAAVRRHCNAGGQEALGKDGGPKSRGWAEKRLGRAAGLNGQGKNKNPGCDRSVHTRVEDMSALSRLSLTPVAPLSRVSLSNLSRASLSPSRLGGVKD